MTLPTHDAQPSKRLGRPQIVPPTHSIPAMSPVPAVPLAPQSTPNPLSQSASGYDEEMAHEHAIDIATQSWDLATGGMKTLTAKRELPLPARSERRVTDILPDGLSKSPRNDTFVMIILVCVALMLVGGGIVLFILLQP
ncbi:hypothetical protein EPA93_40800 [Ktedonosporobacter rubrisoli]|uniref:Uncharacterized protein n=1 Tax=Ktedonosporobacter rubrisoli TaxID=2509675 RepID=A0A4V0Z049_KTERU|nr:hypothetical protein [Ktedonosporobacter rubrisoli]QBD81981.1 hypothetical protein EPA93_40800 [Ktedonosporobacter rubrisoli]